MFGLTRFSLLCAFAVLPLTGTVCLQSAVPAYAAFEDESEEQGLVSTKRSNIAAVSLPQDTFRYIGKKEIAKLAEVLKAMAKGNYSAILWT